MKTLVKVIGKSGQVSFGKEHAGRRVLIEQTGPGEWRVRSATVIPDSEKWLHTPDVAQSLDRALDWERRNPPGKTNLARFEKEMIDERGAGRSSRKTGSQ